MGWLEYGGLLEVDEWIGSGWLRGCGLCVYVCVCVFVWVVDFNGLFLILCLCFWLGG